MNATIVERTTDLLPSVSIEQRLHSSKEDATDVIHSPDESDAHEIIGQQYINLPRLPDSLPKVQLVPDGLSGELLGQHVVELTSTNDIVSPNPGGQFYEDLLPHDLTEEDKRLAAALVAVQLVQQQKHQNSMIPADLLSAKAIPSLSPFSNAAIDKPGMAAMVTSYIQAFEEESSQQHLLEPHQDRLKVYPQPVSELPESELKLPKTLKVDIDMTITDQNIESFESDYEVDGDLKPSRRSLPHKKRIPRKLKTQPQRNIHSKCYKCQKCGDSFSNQSSFFSHRAQHIVPPKRPNMFSCEICASQFPNQMKFFEHLKTHYEPKNPSEPVISTDNQDYSDPNDPVVVLDTYSLKSDCPQERKIIDSGLSCEHCGRGFRRQKAYEMHKASVHQPIEEFSEPEDMMEGIRHVVNIQTDTADDDSEEKLRSWRFTDDMELTPESEISAEPKSFQGADNFEDSIVESPNAKGKKRKTKATQCPHCSRVFIHRNSLMYHIRSHSGRRPHQCEVCGKSFFAANALRVHMRMHSGDKPYKCKECSRRFRQWGDLKYHMTSLHSTQKQYQCEFCGKDFARKYSLIVHRRIHTGEKNYVCEFCRKTFRASSYLVNHRRIHTGEKPYTCDVCRKPFRVKSDMKRHRNTHNKERNVPQERFTQDSILTGAEPESILPDSGTPLNLNMRNDSDSLSYSREALDRDPSNTLYVWLPASGDSILSDE